MEMKRYLLIFIFLFMLVDRKKEWDIYKTKVIIRKGGKWLFKKLIKKWSSY
jgi:hypothetical protein